MKYFFVAVVLLIATIAPAWADKAEIQKTIQSQINAFQEDDFEVAFEFASPNIQRIFKSSKRFGVMVSQSYPMVYRPADVRFLELEAVQDEFWQKLQIQDQQGRYHIMAYRMISVDGKWLINGVQLLPSDEIGV
jgi:hypothetical protein